MANDGKSFDVFLSHHSADKDAVENIAARLEDGARLTPFLDKWHLVPGEPWQEALEQALDQSRTCAVFIGPHGIGPWENLEMRSALSDLVLNKGFRVIPVLLPGALEPEKDTLPRFLRLLTWVDFRGPQELDDTDTFQRLVAGIRGTEPGRGANLSQGSSPSEDKQKTAVLRFLEDVEQVVSTVNLFHTPQTITLREHYIPIHVTLERKYRHEVETSWGYAESEAELTRAYALKREEEDSRRSQVSWEEAKKETQHLIVLADPGMGKSTLLRMEAGITAQEEYQQLHENQKAADAVCLPILLRLSDFVQTEEEVADAIPRLLCRDYPQTAQAILSLLEAKLQKGHCLVLLDAFDEVPVESRAALTEKLNRFARNYPCPLICTSRIVGYGGAFVAGAREVEIVPFGLQQIEQYVHTWFANAASVIEDQTVSAAGLLRELRLKPQIGGLTQNPLLLSLLCSLYQEQELSLPARRSQVYEKAVGYMLSNWGKQNRRDTQSNEWWTMAKTELLETLAYEFSCEGKEVFSQRELFQKMMRALQQANAPRELQALPPSTLLTEFTQEDGILQQLERGGDRYLFLHRTFQEYFTASYIQHVMEQNSDKGLALAHAHFWDYEWHETLTLLAGQLSDPLLLLQALLEKKDDIFSSLLVLAGRCLAEVEEESHPLAVSVIDKLYSLWRSYSERSYILSPIIALGQTHSQMSIRLEEALQGEDASVRWRAAEALGLIGSEQAIPALTTALQHEKAFVRQRAAEALGKIGSAQAILALTTALQHEDASVRWPAAEALGLIGSAQAIPALTTALQHEEAFVRRQAAEALGKIGSAQAIPALTTLDELVSRSFVFGA